MATVLIADDRPLNRQYLVTLLGYFGHRLVEASNGEVALRLARAERPGLVISDMVMPVMDGPELVSRLQNDGELAKVPVILYSATYNLRQAEAMARQVGAFGVLPKPSEPEVILKMVHAALGLPEPAVAPAIEARDMTGASLTSQFPEQLADFQAISYRLSAIIEMSLEMAAEREPERLLGLLAHSARKLIGAKYAAVGLLTDDGQKIRVFLSSGAGETSGCGANGTGSVPFAPKLIEAPPSNSILANLLKDRQVMRLRKIPSEDLGLAVTFAPGHSQLECLLGVPLGAPSGLAGWLLLGDKLGAGEFSGEDARVIATLASHGVLAYERLDERRHAAEELRKSQATLETVFESAPDAFVASDVEGRIKKLNAQAEQIFGYSRVELVGQHVDILVPQRLRSKHSGDRQDYHHNPHHRHMGSGIELVGRRKDGTEFPADIMLSPIQTEQGNLVLSVVRDLTKRKQAEDRILRLNQELKQRVADLETANQSLEAFSYSVSHDLRTPLRSIEGFSRILSEDHGPRLDREVQRLLGMIASNARKMASLIEDLLSFSRVSRSQIRKSALDMKSLAESVVEQLRAAEPARQIAITIQPMPAARGDLPMLRQVYANLISNAWKFTRDKTDAAIEIGSYPNGERNVYFVKDNGAGFNMEYAQKLFGVFQRLHSDREFEGAGIGLALVRRIIQRHGGEVWGQGNVGVGATFCFTL
ncbi:MAG TPA: PAS domain S-box protein [Terriglobia bacterium]|nr:PAS domain S-box protein [Terriglobia bacterium]